MPLETIKKISLAVEQHIGQKLKQRRQELGLTQYELGKKLEITSQQVHKYEKGIDRLSASRLLELGKLLSVSTSFFYEGLEGPSGQGKELLVRCVDKKGKKFIIKLLDDEGIFSEMEVLDHISWSEEAPLS